MKDDIQVPKHKGKKETSIIVTYIDHTLFLSIQCSFQILFSFRVYNAKCQNVLIIKNFLVQLLKLFSSYIVIIELYNQKKKVLIVHVWGSSEGIWECVSLPPRKINGG